jgi:hypothetical protein
MYYSKVKGISECRFSSSPNFRIETKTNEKSNTLHFFVRRNIVKILIPMSLVQNSEIS